MAVLFALLCWGSFAGSAAAASQADPAGHGLGWKPTPGLAQGLSATAAHLAAKSQTLPASADLSAWAPPVGNQGPISSCASWATGYDYRYWVRNRVLGQKSVFAPMFLYSQIAHGNPNAGTTFADNISILESQGIPHEADYRQGYYDYTTQPTAAETAAAARYKVSSGTWLFSGTGGDNRTAVEASIAAGRPVLLGIPVYANFESATSSHYFVGVPSSGMKYYGGHAVFAPKYDASGLWIENSWGTGWGKGGWAELSWAFVNKYAFEGWTMAADDGVTLVVSGMANPSVAGAAHNVTVAAYDPAGRTATGYRGTIHFTSTDTQAILPGDYTFTAADAGVHKFSRGVTLETAGTREIRATDVSTAATTGAQTGIVVTTAAAGRVTVLGVPSPYVAGAAHNVTVAVTDAYGNAATGYRGTIHFTSSDVAATLPSSYTFTARDAGIHVFSLGVALRTTGTQSVGATDTRKTNLTGAQSAIAVVGKAPSKGVAVGWGLDYRGATDVPTGLSGITAIAGGYDFGLALKSDGTVVAWGDDGAGQTDVPSRLKSVTAISAGRDHSLALKRDGTVVGWGALGQSDIPTGLSHVVAIAAGNGYSLALKSDGTVVSWGHGPTLPAGLSGVTAIAAGYGYSLALKSDGTVVAWGDASDGKTAVPAGLSGVIAIAAGPDHSLALRSNGTVVAWGYDGEGAAEVPAGLSGVAAMAAGDSFNLALKSDSTVVAWGYTGFGATTVPAGLSGVTAISAGYCFGLALEPTSTTLTVSGLPSLYLAGVASTVTVTVRDAHGNVDGGYRGTVHFASSDRKAKLPADYTFTAADAGVHQFSLAVTLKTAGSHSIRVTDLVTATISVAQVGIAVS